MDIKNLVLSDDALNVIDNGAWVGDFDGAPGLELKVCGMNSQEANKARIKAQETERMKNKGQMLTTEQLADCTRIVLAEVVLKDWRGLTDNGQEVKYDKAKAKEWIMSRNGERFAGLVLMAAQSIDGDANAFVDQVAKN